MVFLSVVLPTYNRGSVVVAFLESLLSQSYQDWELIVVDDASSDNTLSIISKYTSTDKRIRIHHLEMHEGLPAARNVGVALSNADLLFFGEDDITYCDPNSLEILIETYFNLKDKIKIGAIGPRINGNGGYNWINDITQIGPISRTIYHNFDYDPHQVKEVLTLHSCSLISKQAFRKVGGFDERLYLGTHAKEEVDFYFRLRKEGYKILFQPCSTIWHNRVYIGGCDTSKKLRKYYYEMRNSTLFVARFDGIIFSYLFLFSPLYRRFFEKRIL